MTLSTPQHPLLFEGDHILDLASPLTKSIAWSPTFGFNMAIWNYSACILPTVGCTVLHCTLHTAHCTLHTAHCTLHTAHCTLHTAHCTLHTAHCTLHTACTLCTVYCVLCAVYCTLCTVHCVLCIVHCTLYTVHCTLYSVQCTVYTVQCTRGRVTVRQRELQRDRRGVLPAPAVLQRPVRIHRLCINHMAVSNLHALPEVEQCDGPEQSQHDPKNGIHCGRSVFRRFKTLAIDFMDNSIGNVYSKSEA